MPIRGLEEENAPAVKMSRWPKVFVALCWASGLLVVPKLWEAARATFETDTTPFEATKELLTPKSGVGPTVRLDTLSGIVLVYSAQCTACKSNTDNWVRLVAETRQRAPGTPIYLVAAPPDSLARTSVSPWLASVFTEYLLPGTVVDSALGVSFLPSTVILRHGTVVRRVNGILGPRRREAALRDLTTGGVD